MKEKYYITFQTEGSCHCIACKVVNEQKETWTDVSNKKRESLVSSEILFDRFVYWHIITDQNNSKLNALVHKSHEQGQIIIIDDRIHYGFIETTLDEIEEVKFLMKISSKGYQERTFQTLKEFCASTLNLNALDFADAIQKMISMVENLGSKKEHYDLLYKTIADFKERKLEEAVETGKDVAIYMEITPVTNEDYPYYIKSEFVRPNGTRYKEEGYSNNLKIIECGSEKESEKNEPEEGMEI